MKICVASLNYTDGPNDALAASNVEGRGIEVTIVDQNRYGFTAEYVGSRDALIDMLTEYFALDAPSDVDLYAVL